MSNSKYEEKSDTGERPSHSLKTEILDAVFTDDGEEEKDPIELDSNDAFRRPSGDSPVHPLRASTINPLSEDFAIGDISRALSSSVCDSAAFGLTKSSHLSGAGIDAVERLLVEEKGKDVIIMGGGIGGCTAALELADAGYNVTILELRDGLLEGTSGNTPGRLGLGFHYRDFDTAREYMHATIAFTRRFLVKEEDPYISMTIGGEAIKSRECQLQYVVAEGEDWGHELRHGLYFGMKDSQVSKDELLKVAENLQEEYTKLCAQDPKNQVFGPPGEFYRVLEGEDIPEGIHPDVDFGIRTQEHLLNWPKFKDMILSRTKTHPKVKVFCGSDIQKFKRSSAKCFKESEEREDDGIPSYDVICSNGKIYRGNILINATWEGIDSINRESNVVGKYERVEDEKLDLEDKDGSNKWRRSIGMTNRQKVIVEVKLPDSMENHPSMFFYTDKDGNGAMLSNLGNGIARITFSRITNHRVANDGKLTKDMEKDMYVGMTVQDRRSIGGGILAGVIEYIPKLREASIISVATGIVRSVGEVDMSNSRSAVHVRTGDQIREREPGVFDFPAMKFTRAVLNADKIVRMVDSEYNRREKIKKVLEQDKMTSEAGVRVVSKVICSNSSVVKVEDVEEVIRQRQRLVVQLEEEKLNREKRSR